MCTLGVIYLAGMDALDRREERMAREEDERAERVIAANKGRLQNAVGGGKKKKKLTPSQQVSNLPNRRERRRMEREGVDQVDEE